MKIVTFLAALAGLLLGTVIVGYYGFGGVLHSLLAIGWTGFLIILAYHCCLYLILGLAWHAVLPAPRTSPWTVVWGRLIRDSGSEILPLSQIGGFIMGARAASLLGLPTVIAFASTVVDVTLELLGQLAYTALGLTLLVMRRPDAPVVWPIAIGLAAAVLATLAFVVVQRRGSALFERFTHRLAVQWLSAAASGAKPTQDAIQAIYRNPAGLRRGFFLHVLGWIGNGAEAWLALRLMGVSLDIGAVLAIESLLYAIRSAAFFVPNAVGVQEGAYVMLGGLFGLPPDSALALSLLKRARDLTIGVPALIAWQTIEGKRLWRRGAKQAPDTAKPIP